MPYETASQRDAAIAAALAAISTTAEVNGLLAAALADYSTTAQANGLIATALADYSTTAQVNSLIATAVGGIDLSNYYERSETYSQSEVNSVVSGAIDALNIAQYRTESQVSASISDALVPYYTASEVDAAIASNSFTSRERRATPGSFPTTPTQAMRRCSRSFETACPSQGKSGASCPGRHWPGATCSVAPSPS